MGIYTTLSIPHPFPYQGSKRSIARYILPYFPSDVKNLVEPFCGAGAVSIAACAYRLVDSVTLNDLNKPLMRLWEEILERPAQLSDNYEKLWLAQQQDSKKFFLKIRDEFNESHQPHHLLYLLARIVKGSIRYCGNGKFNQSPDNRRLGMKPATIRRNIAGISRLLKNKATIYSEDFRAIANRTITQDLVYMDPPYQGTSFTRDHRYYNGLTYNTFVEALAEMNNKSISYIVSYDGITGNKQHGRLLPEFLSLKHLQIHAGRSTQSTLLGSADETIESLYLSPALVRRLESEKTLPSCGRIKKPCQLAFAYE